MAKKKSEFQWTQKSEVYNDEWKSNKIFQSQMQIMRRLFRSNKRQYSLVEWHMRRLPSDLHLYAALGMLNPLEYDCFANEMTRWQNELLEEAEKEHEDRDTDVTVFVPAKRLHLYLKHLAKDFDTNENFLMRYEKPARLIRALGDALYLEGLRCDPEEGVSAVDELLCQKVYPEGESLGWVWMNKMIAGKSHSPLKLQLDSADEALKELNEFSLYKALADIYEYGWEPVAYQRLNGKLEPCSFRERLPRINSAFMFLIVKKLIDPSQLKRVFEMSADRRQEKQMMLKRKAVSAFLSDITQASPDALWVHRMVYSFGAYFKGILDEIGNPTLATKKIVVKGDDGQKRYRQEIKVCFPAVKSTDKMTKKKQIISPKSENSKSSR